MSLVAELLCSRRVPHAAVLALVSFAFAGCSADTSSRFSQTTLGNPFNYQPEATGSVPSAAPAPQVERQELPQYARPHPYASSASGAPPVVAAPQSYPSANAGVSGGGRGMASYTPPVNNYAPPAQPHLETTGSVPPRSVAAAPRPAHIKIIVGTSDTLEIVAHRYHVTPAAIMAANGYKGPRTLSPGQSLLVPQPATPATTAAAPVPAAPVAALAPATPARPATKPVAVAAAPMAAATIHVVNHGDTLHSIARRYHVSVGELAHANNLDTGAKLKLGSRLNVPGKVAATAVAAASVAAPQLVAAAPVVAPKLAAAAAPQQSARLAQASPAAEDGAPEPAIKASEATGALPTFRWPVRGKVIASYGAKTNGKSNDGINLAVPEGTPVKAAEDGVVAYAGNELKGYGNLVLVRHANGYVTAYAHASELLVKRGDTIKRGQVIAKSGQSGEVASPQLHFEIRKGSSPVDPLQFLNGA
ncbi:LysM peptidoglycan-binding domain-containing M23 family metallopeptidase [Bradyrhizobium sp. Tv2a-2]|uniref:LysM peptidoglycan-binding domain-containing M23 family metallopeptidase n=1 Tax=Bradyrhizobium sp. Tv2a-2 TaxID=113395 RepID=UPI000409161F|nr:LysM peptidoglycan-binding domain-containing M23 family metallopeptidase [Bradyrhizobium sp. Tv2a-2]